jgi:hypothetical protein
VRPARAGRAAQDPLDVAPPRLTGTRYRPRSPVRRVRQASRSAVGGPLPMP